uniref:NADH-ubiquinone oxidoreductase chain 5 n=1 Tax=Mengenilla australiensis TaxID=701070 RepID=D2K8M0_9NEOP|nr:NADH dehydrogenase subunit 5 [Mengenilla australiensis]
MYKMNLFFYINFFLSIIFFYISILFFYKMKLKLIEWEIYNYYSLEFGLVILLDWISLLFMSYVLFISSWVMYYSNGYMSNDKFKNRFLLMLMLFVLSMIMLIISPNIISLLFGWDGLGLISYYLVSYYQNFNSYNSGMITFLSNRIGDSFMLISIFLMMDYGGWNFIFYNYLEFNLFMLVMIILASMTKSAQIPFSLWLPMAMAAPTPVSSLVHSSTLVTAGIYLLIRFYEFFKFNLDKFNLFIYLFIMTMMMSSMSALMEMDLKKIIALSTLSQLSLMFMMLFMGFKELAFFHLLTHAIFKSLLFLCSGIIIHNYKNYQDIRVMGSLNKIMPMVSCYLNISGLSLCGLPFLSSFYTKDYIMELMFSEYYFNIMFILIYMLSISLTLLYYCRLIYYLNFNWLNLSSLNYFLDNKWLMMDSMKLLLIFSLIIGSIMMWFFLGNIKLVIMENLLFMMTYLLMLLILFKFFEKFIKMKLLNMQFYFFMNMWYLNYFFMNKFILLMSMNFMNTMEKGWGELIGSQGVFWLYKNFSLNYQIYQFNNFKYFMILFILMFYLVIFL